MVPTSWGQSRYQPLFERRGARCIHVRAAQLTADGYPQVVGSADLGISVHRSASGLDLPMKICDLFGGGVPVCAPDDGPCLSELVRDGDNGVLFHTADELAMQMFSLLQDRSGERPRALGQSASASMRWHQGRAAEAWPVLRGEVG